MDIYEFEKRQNTSGILAIPMAMRFKLDAVGVKISLQDWLKLQENEKLSLIFHPFKTLDDHAKFLSELYIVLERNGITKSCNEKVNLIEALEGALPINIIEMANEYKIEINEDNWKGFDILQKYTLVKLSRPGHKNKNFEAAIKEFIGQ